MLTINLIEPTQAHQAFKTLWEKVKNELVAGNKQMLTLEKLDEKKIRTLEQNALLHKWYQIIERELGQDTILGWSCYCKLTFGVPMLIAENNKFREAYEGSIDCMSYERQLKIMEILPVTRLMTTRQLNQYLEAMKDYFDKAGLVLMFPDELLMSEGERA
jgi:hypothetical protein